MESSNNKKIKLPENLKQFLKQIFDNNEFIKLPIDLVYSLNEKYEECSLMMVPKKVQDVFEEEKNKCIWSGKKESECNDKLSIIRENFLYKTEYLYVFPEKYVYMDKTLGEFGVYFEDLCNFYFNDYSDYPFIYINIGGYVAIADYGDYFKRYLEEK